MQYSAHHQLATLHILLQVLIQLEDSGTISTIFKVREAEHESFFQKPFCVFCGNIILARTRKGL
jgi:hypothetical protein